MTRLKKVLDAWPESAKEMLALIQSYFRLKEKHNREYDLALSIFGVSATRSEINAVLNSDDKLATAGTLLAEKIYFWS